MLGTCVTFGNSAGRQFYRHFAHWFKITDRMNPLALVISIVLVIIPLCLFPVYSNTNDSLVASFDLPEDLIGIRIVYAVGYTPLPL